MRAYWRMSTSVTAAWRLMMGLAVAVIASSVVAADDVVRNFMPCCDLGSTKQVFGLASQSLSCVLEEWV